LSGWRWLLNRMAHKLWVRAALFSVLAGLTALVAAAAGPHIPYEFSAKIGAASVDGILRILTGSMLGVTTFSLTVMVTTFSSASGAAPPRATALLAEDSIAQGAISTFLGSFIFAAVGLIALGAGVYGATGRVVLLGATVALLILVVATLVRWIDHLARLSRVGETAGRVEKAARDAMRRWAEQPRLGCRPPPPVRPEGRALYADTVGYVQNIDVGRLSRLARTAGLEAHLDVLPGSFVHPRRPLAVVVGEADGAMLERMRRAFMIGSQRSFEQDPRFGLIVLAEIASRALSPGVNDAGTAIDVLTSGARLLEGWRAALDGREDEIKAPHDNLSAPDLNDDDLMDGFFRPVARDGAGQLEVGVALQKALGVLIQPGGRLAAPGLRLSKEALARAEDVLALDHERRALRASAQQQTRPSDGAAY
jgi:uncharacterized membrane protein